MSLIKTKLQDYPWTRQEDGIICDLKELILRYSKYY
jgi:hypothetical protein